MSKAPNAASASEPAAEPPVLRQDLSDAIDAFWVENYLGGDAWQWRQALERRESLKSVLSQLLSKG